MTATVKLNWRVPAAEWDAFRAFVAETHGETKGRLGRETERAMREFTDADEFAAVDERVDGLVRAAGRTPANLTDNKSFVAADGAPTTRACVRVPHELKEEFAGYAEHEAEERPGMVLARALRERRDGGRAGRVRRKLDRVGADAEAMLAEVKPDADPEERMTTTERRTVAICTALPDQFPCEELEATIADVAGDAPQTVEKYTERVLDHCEMVPHPENEDLFIPASERPEIARSLAEERRREADREADALFGTDAGTAATDGGETRR